MNNQTAPDTLPAAAPSAAAGAAARPAAATQPDPQKAHRTRPTPIKATTGETQPPPAATTSTQDATRHEIARPPAPRGRPAITAEQAQHIFHDLHAEGRNTLCAVCDSQYELE
jgi:hypothetical protein